MPGDAGGVPVPPADVEQLGDYVVVAGQSGFGGHLKIGNGVVIVSVDGKDAMYSQRNACPHCGISLGDLEPRTFSFNSPFGACRGCNGLGIKIEFDPDLIIPDRSKSILDGAIKPWTGHFATFRSAMLRDVGRKFGFDLATPIAKMKPDQLKVILYGTDEGRLQRSATGPGDSWQRLH